MKNTRIEHSQTKILKTLVIVLNFKLNPDEYKRGLSVFLSKLENSGFSIKEIPTWNYIITQTHKNEPPQISDIIITTRIRAKTNSKDRSTDITLESNKLILRFDFRTHPLVCEQEDYKHVTDLLDIFKSLNIESIIEEQAFKGCPPSNSDNFVRRDDFYETDTGDYILHQENYKRNIQIYQIKHIYDNDKQIPIIDILNSNHKKLKKICNA